MSETTEQPRTLTNGEFLVGISFNPGKHQAVEQLKALGAAYIDLVEKLAKTHADAVAKPRDTSAVADGPPPSLAETSRRQQAIGRCVSLAVTQIEQASMWAVKAVTK